MKEEELKPDLNRLTHGRMWGIKTSDDDRFYIQSNEPCCLIGSLVKPGTQIMEAESDMNLDESYAKVLGVPTQWAVGVRRAFDTGPACMGPQNDPDFESGVKFGLKYRSIALDTSRTTQKP